MRSAILFWNNFATRIKYFSCSNYRKSEDWIKWPEEMSEPRTGSRTFFRSEKIENSISFFPSRGVYITLYEKSFLPLCPSGLLLSSSCPNRTEQNCRNKPFTHVYDMFSRSDSHNMAASGSFPSFFSWYLWDDCTGLTSTFLLSSFLFLSALEPDNFIFLLYNRTSATGILRGYCIIFLHTSTCEGTSNRIRRRERGKNMWWKGREERFQLNFLRISMLDIFIRGSVSRDK